MESINKRMTIAIVAGLCLVAGISYWLSGNLDGGQAADGPIPDIASGQNLKGTTSAAVVEPGPEQAGEAAVDDELNTLPTDPWEKEDPIAVTLKKIGELDLTWDHMQTQWQSEYGCGPGAASEGCADSPYVAHSPEEAVWMYRAGYIPASVEAEVAALSDDELKTLSLRRESSGYMQILARRFSEQGNDKAADDAFILAKVFALQSDPLNSAIYVSRAEHVLNRMGAQPDREQLMLAMKDLQIANLLGDTAAANQLQRIAEDERYGLTVADIEAVTQGSESFFEKAWVEWNDERPLPRRP